MTDEAIASAAALCASCGNTVGEIGLSVHRMINNLGQLRLERLATLFGGQAPDDLCVTCFNRASSVINGAHDDSH